MSIIKDLFFAARMTFGVAGKSSFSDKLHWEYKSPVSH